MKDYKNIMPPGSDLLNGNSYFTRYVSFLIKNRFGHTADEYRLFPYRKTGMSVQASCLPGCNGLSYPGTIGFYDNGILSEENLDSFFTRTRSTAFLVMKDGRLILEKYYNGFRRDSIFRIYSITKSIVSTLVGIAIGDGLLGSVNDKITLYLPELNKNINAGDITIRHLLLMNWGVRLKEGYAPWNDEPKTYLNSNCRKFALECRIDKTDDHFHYNDYHPLLLGLILERVTGTNLTEYLHEKLWKHLGAEYEAIFTCDSPENMFEKAESGLNLRAVDLLRFGQLALNNGNIHGRQVIPENWMCESTSPLNDSHPERYSFYNGRPWGRLVFNKPQNYYKYFWWGSKLQNENYDFYALGVLGQVLYISPEQNAIAIRLGNSWTIRDWWPRVLKAYISKI